MKEASPLQREIRQAKPFRSRGQQVVVALLRTADLVRRVVGRVLEPYDITPQQYNVLRILRGAGDRGLPTLEIGERMIEQTPGITRLLDRLEAKELVRRERCREDRRAGRSGVRLAGRALRGGPEGAGPAAPPRGRRRGVLRRPPPRGRRGGGAPRGADRFRGRRSGG